MRVMLAVSRRLATGLLVSMLGLFAGTAVIEGWLRLQEWLRPPETGRTRFWEADRDLGWGHPAGRTGRWFDDRGEFAAPVRINSKRLRDIEHPYERHSAAFRILLIGDSYIEAVQVELEDSFPRVLERDLVRFGSVPVEVINGGVADYGTDNELLFYRHEGKKYEVDLVVLAFTLANDVRNNFEPLNRLAAIGNKNKPTFRLNPSGELELTPMMSPPPPSWSWRNLKVAGLLMDRLGIGSPSAAPPPPSSPGARPTKPETRGKALPVDALVYDPQPSTEVEGAWEVTFALVRAMRREVTEQKTAFAAFLINGPWVHSDGRWRFLMQADPQAMKTWDPQKPNKVMGEFFMSEAIPYLDLRESFDLAKHDRLFFDEDPHWAPAGHRVAAAAVAQFLLRDGLVPKRAVVKQMN